MNTTLLTCTFKRTYQFNIRGVYSGGHGCGGSCWSLSLCTLLLSWPWDRFFRAILLTISLRF